MWEIVNNLTRLRPSKGKRYRVTICGSARAKPGTFVYDEVKRVAAALAEMGCDIVTGGGPGLMQNPLFRVYGDADLTPEGLRQYIAIGAE